MKKEKNLFIGKFEHCYKDKENTANTLYFDIEY